MTNSSFSDANRYFNILRRRQLRIDNKRQRARPNTQLLNRIVMVNALWHCMRLLANHFWHKAQYRKVNSEIRTFWNLPGTLHDDISHCYCINTANIWCFLHKGYKTIRTTIISSNNEWRITKANFPSWSCKKITWPAMRWCILRWK